MSQAKLKYTDDDLFQDSTMSFGEHLEELRTSLSRALIGVILGFLIGLYFAPAVVDLIQQPFQDALKEYYKVEALKNYSRWREEQLQLGVPLPDDSPALQYVVTNRNMVPQPTMIQPWQVFAQLGQKHFVPTLPAVTGPTTFKPEDFRDPEGLASQLVADAIAAEKSQSAAPASQIWSKLSDKQKTAIQDADSEAAAGKALADGFNAVIAKPFYDEAAFAEFPKFDETVYLLSVQESGKLDLNQQQRLGRLLIEAAYGDDLKQRSAPNFVSMFTWVPIALDDRVKLTALNAHEAFMIYIKAALITGLVISSPWVFWQLWMFVAAGLYPHEKHYVYVFLPVSMALFLVGACFAFFLVFQPVLDFLLGFNRLLGIDPDPRISEWLSFVLFLPLGFGLSFQLPLVMLFLERIQIFDVEIYLTKWRIAILVIAVISMLLTPADPTSMMLMAVPLWFLYFLGILMCKYFPRGRSPFDEPDPGAAT